MTSLLTGFLTAVAGVVSGWVLARWQCRRLLTTLQETYVDPTNIGRRGPTVVALILILLVAAMTLIGFGIQQSANQKQARDRSACTERWGREVIDTLTNRTEANTNVDRAAERRDNAVDEVLTTVIRLRARPPAAKTRDLDVALQTFAGARADLDAARTEAAKTRRENPYPDLNCR